MTLKDIYWDKVVDYVHTGYQYPEEIEYFIRDLVDEYYKEIQKR